MIPIILIEIDWWKAINKLYLICETNIQKNGEIQK